MTRGRPPRTGLRSTDSHGSWREVYAQLGVDTTQHEIDDPGMYQTVPNSLDAETGEPPGRDR